MKRWYIYALSDPRTGETRYIGKTINVDWRVAEHTQEALDNVHTPKARWIRGLLNNGLWPDDRVLDQGCDDGWSEAEKFYIRFFREEVGSRLLNMTDGGEGAPGHVHSTESRSKMGVRKGKTHSEASKLKIRAARARQVLPPLSSDARKRISDAKRGKVRPDLVSNQYNQRFRSMLEPELYSDFQRLHRRGRQCR